MYEKKKLSSMIIILLLQAPSRGQEYPYLTIRERLNSVTASNGIEKPVTIRIIYYNYARVDSLGLKPILVK
jgi:hypothetical protein